jgi:hypothetical protein
MSDFPVWRQGLLPQRAGFRIHQSLYEVKLGDRRVLQFDIEDSRLCTTEEVMKKDGEVDEQNKCL